MCACLSTYECIFSYINAYSINKILSLIHSMYSPETHAFYVLPGELIFDDSINLLIFLEFSIFLYHSLETVLQYNFFNGIIKLFCYGLFYGYCSITSADSLAPPPTFKAPKIKMGWRVW